MFSSQLTLKKNSRISNKNVIGHLPRAGFSNFRIYFYKKSIACVSFNRTGHVFLSLFFLSRTKRQTFLTETNANYRRALRFPIEMSFDTVKTVAFRWCNLEARAPLNAKRLQFDTFVLGGMQIRISSIVPVPCPLDKSRRLFFSASPKWIFQGPPSFEPDTSRPHESHNLLA